MSADWNSWDAIAEFLRLLVDKSGYTMYVEALLALIPRLRAAEGFEDMQPGLSHLTITLSIPGHRRKIHVDGDQPGYYNIYVDHLTENLLSGGNFYGETVTVPLDEVIAVLQTYASRLRMDESDSG